MDELTAIVPVKRCPVCGGEFPRTAEFFYPLRRGGAELHGTCRTCTNAVATERRQEYRGLTESRGGRLNAKTYDMLFRRQEGLCAVTDCRRPALPGHQLKLYVRVRAHGAARFALLCALCDAALKLLDDDLPRVIGLAAFLSIADGATAELRVTHQD